MILDELKSWSGCIEVDGVKYQSIEDVKNLQLTDTKSSHSIILHNCTLDALERKISRVESIGDAQYRISVRQYMTRKATPDFDFMLKWNKDNPMPLRTMVGTVEKETRGMIYAKLHGDITSRTTQYCLKCGREITNPISQYFGMGPECGGHNYTNPFESEEDLQDAINEYRKEHLRKITWEGWIIKSAITEQEELSNGI